MTYGIALAVVWGVLVAGAGGGLTVLSPWYYALRKPSWQPPDWLFGPAWTVILSLASYAFYLAWRESPDTRWLTYLVFGANGILNIVWSPLFFTMRRPDWALVEVPFLWLSIVAVMAVLAPISSFAMSLMVPYLLWVSFAALLNLKIVRLNRPFHTQGLKVFWFFLLKKDKGHSF